MPNPTYQTIDEYIDTCPLPIQPILRELRAFIKQKAPEASEKIAWAMPTFYQKGNLLHFMAHKSHIGFYPGANGIEQFKDDFEALHLKYSKGAVQFPFNQPLPLELIERIIVFKVKENES